MNLIGLNDNVGAVDISAIASDEFLVALQKMSEGDAVATIKKLPENILTKVCTQGVNEKLSAYIPDAVVGVGVGLVVGYSTDSFVYGLLAAAAAGGLVYYIRQSQTPTT